MTTVKGILQFEAITLQPLGIYSFVFPSSAEKPKEFTENLPTLSWQKINIQRLIDFAYMSAY